MPRKKGCVKSLACWVPGSIPGAAHKDLFRMLFYETHLTLKEENHSPLNSVGEGLSRFGSYLKGIWQAIVERMVHGPLCILQDAGLREWRRSQWSNYIQPPRGVAFWMAGTQ